MCMCVYLQTCTHTITEICNKRPNGRASFLFLFYFYNIASRTRTVAHTHVRKYVCMYHARVFMLYNSSSSNNRPPPPPTQPTTLLIIGRINSDPAAGALTSNIILLCCTCGRQLDWLKLTDASAVMHSCVQHVC